MSIYNSTGEMRWFIAAQRLNRFYNGVQDVPHRYKSPLLHRSSGSGGDLAGGQKGKVHHAD